MRFWLILGLSLAALAGCSAPAANCPEVPEGFISEQGAGDVERLITLFQKNDFTAAWVKPGKVFWVSHDEMPGKVLLEYQDKTRALRFATVYNKKEGAEVEPATLFQLNLINYKGFVKVYVDKDGDLWTESYYPIRDGAQERSLMVFTRQFARYSRDAAKLLSDYLK